MKTWHKLVALGWGLFAISFFLPVATDGTTIADGQIPGWEALTAALQGHVGIFGIVSGLTNLVMLFTPAVIWIRQRNLALILIGLVAMSALLNSWWFVGGDARGDLMLGYYMWWLSFAVVAFGLGLLIRERFPLWRHSSW